MRRRQEISIDNIMIFKFIHLPTFVFSLAIGLLFVYLYNPDTRNIIVYPTPDTAEILQYRDKAGNCFQFKQTEVKCPSRDKISRVPAQ